MVAPKALADIRFALLQSTSGFGDGDRIVIEPVSVEAVQEGGDSDGDGGGESGERCRSAVSQRARPPTLRISFFSSQASWSLSLGSQLWNHTHPRQHKRKPTRARVARRFANGSWSAEGAVAAEKRGEQAAAQKKGTQKGEGAAKMKGFVTRPICKANLPSHAHCRALRQQAPKGDCAGGGLL